ncbi:F-box protein [Ceratobasidium sp. AG-Ba]|nr:F-box protein [Ceratobasidium sp. AG-Ba]
MILPSVRVPLATATNTRSQCLFYHPGYSLRLPNEVWVAILDCLPVLGVLQCRQLCRKIKHIVDSTVRLQYRIELYATGNVDGGVSNPLSTASRLARLRDIDRGWRTLEWKSQRSEPWTGDCPNYELAGGVFARGRSTVADPQQLEADDGHHFTAAIDVIVFPPRDGSGSSVRWSHEQVGLLVHDFTIAPEQDLVVLVGHRHEGAIDEPIPIHLRTLSNNVPHPMATLPVLFAYPQPPDVFISDFTIQIYDSLLGILFWGAHAFHLMIWDWCLGELVVDYPAPAGIHFDDFSFLSGSSFLIPSSSAGGAALRVYSFAHLLPSSSPSYQQQQTHPLGRAPHHLEFDNSGRRVAPACWTPARPDGTVRSFHIGNYVFCVSNLEEACAMPPGAAGLSGLTKRPELRSLLRFPKPKREWNVGIMTCRVDPLPRSGIVRPKKNEGEEEEDETRFAPVRPFHADPDRAIIALSSGLVPVRAGVFAGVVYLDEGSLAWEEGEEDEEGVEQGSDPLPSSSSPPASIPQPLLPPPPPPIPNASTDPPPLTTLVPWIDLHMPPSSLPTPAEPPLMSVFDHSSASSGHAPIQIQIHDALLGEEQQGVTVYPPPHGHGQVHVNGVPPTHGNAGQPGHVHVHGPPAGHGPQPVQAPGGGGAQLPPPFVGALPAAQGVDEDVQVEDMDRLYFNLFVHCRALRRFAEREESAGPTSTLFASSFGPSSRTRTHHPRVYEWDDWAPPITRLLTRMPMPAWACISHGQRFATLGDAGDPNPSQAAQGEVGGGAHGAGVGTNQTGATGGWVEAGLVNVAEPQQVDLPAPIDLNILDGGPGGVNVKRPIRVLDFNPFGVRRHKDTRGHNRVTVFDGETVLPAGKYWEKDVRSALPYREVVTREELLLSGVMIDGERVLGMRSDERGNVSSMHVMQI